MRKTTGLLVLMLASVLGLTLGLGSSYGPIRSGLEPAQLAGEFWATEGDTLFLGGEHVRVPGEDYIKADIDTSLYTTLRQGRLGIAAIKSASGGFPYGATIVSTMDSTRYPSRLLNLVQEPNPGFWRTSFIGSRLILKDDPDTTGTTVTGHLVYANSTVSALGGMVQIDAAGPDSGAHVNLWSKVRGMSPDGKGRLPYNIYADGGHVMLLGGHAGIESLYTDLDAVVLDSDSTVIESKYLRLAACGFAEIATVAGGVDTVRILCDAVGDSTNTVVQCTPTFGWPGGAGANNCSIAWITGTDTGYATIPGHSFLVEIVTPAATQGFCWTVFRY